ncbi:DNAJ heat shock N-terminal domain-containing protein [Tasmannia lanceolata]|uniref:DNAJ heat shock N-terminal domain-containing protein n=1 Tax=Tasmannia lanceolata TaxID=3420 RepID=UPI0040635855
MGGESNSKSSRPKKRLDTSTSSTYSSSSDSESPERRSSSRHREHRRKSVHRSRRENESAEKSRKSKSRRDKKEKRRREREHRRRTQRKTKKASSDSDSEPESPKPESIVRYMLERFPDVVGDLKQLLQMIDDGQAVDTREISNKTLTRLLKKLFMALNLTESDTGVFLLPSAAGPTLEVVGSLLNSNPRPRERQISAPGSPTRKESFPSDLECKTVGEADGGQLPNSRVEDEVPASCKRRVIGPEMPSSELLAAAAKLTEAETELREAEMDAESDLFIGPPPPAVVAEAESANEAERFEEVTRIMGVEVDNPYDVLGVNHKMSVDNVKKRYWKLSLMVHPDKCSHPQAHQAFIILNKAFKELQDPDKRKVTDEKIRLKEEQEAFKAELHALREAAQWRRLQGISMPGDDELLAETKLPRRRDEWMTTLPPERKPGVSMQSTTSFSKTTKEGRGDTSVWTDNPLDKAQKAKMNYLEAYNETAALAANDEKKRSSSDADLVDKYNRSKRSMSLVQKHQEEGSRPKKKKRDQEKEEWVGQHPWKPWDRDKDLTAGRQKVNLDSKGMVEGLSSRFSSGDIQRNFL